MTDWFHAWVWRPDYLPAWLQAGAAVVALGISAWAVIWTSAGARRRDRLELRGILVAIYPEIKMLALSTQTVRERMIEVKKNNVNQVGQGVAAIVHLMTQIPVPPMLERNSDKLFLLGDVAGPSCIHLIRLLMQYNEFASRLVDHIAILNAQQWPRAIEQLDEHLARLDAAIAKCDIEVQPLHDAIKH